ncbi:hypothetical protein QG070_04760 [Kingella kingae]|uniref:hypothetical protein n=1 Tax=Kingella kingae TaxID=504 RepID=UPI00254CD4CA|nr:hypothetical protein [Kingella kingae]MDK4650348.1 hypothetical protein [Kingella kingae]
MTQQPSLKQIRTAQKQAKAIKQMQRVLKSKPLTKQQIKQRQQNAPRISAKQKAYRQYLIDDTRECFSHEDAIAAVKKADAKYNELVYCRDCFVHNGYFQQLHRVLSICVALFDCDTWFTDVLDQAQHALQQEPSTRDQSPNQRRALLQPILDMIDIGYAIMKGLPKDTQTQASHYSMGVQIYAYYLSISRMQPPSHHRLHQHRQWHEMARRTQTSRHQRQRKNRSISPTNFAGCFVRLPHSRMR